MQLMIAFFIDKTVALFNWI